MKVWVYLRSGASFAFEADKITVSRDRLTGVLLELRWDGASKGAPMFLDVTQVDAVVTDRDSGTTVGHPTPANGSEAVS